MRPDMVKVIVERERLGRVRNYHHARNKKKFAPKDLEDAVTHEGMKQRHKFFHSGDGKALNENLSPLKKYLRKQVGRPWSKVYSELNAFVNPRNAVQLHIRTHVTSYVELNAIQDAQGAYYVLGRFGKAYLHEGDLYVNAAGILTQAKRKIDKIKLLPGQKLYTIYRQATHREYGSYSLDYWHYSVKCCLHSEYEKIPASPYIQRQMTFIACGREDIAKALKECQEHYSPSRVMYVKPSKP